MIPTKADPSKTVATFFINNGRRFLAFGNFFYIRILSEDYFIAAKVFLQDADWPVREIGDTDCRIYGIELLGREEFAPTIFDALARLEQNDTNIGNALARLEQNDTNIGNALTGLAQQLARLLGDKIPSLPLDPTYTVCQGDTLGAIASSHSTTVAAIRSLNPEITNPDLIAVGQVIKLPKP